ncbi:dihydroorotase [Thermithiobacillus plumbiphilus]|uniref:Dihydroorotase n=1 Tax=Thermithiobacillus plumbiphilus TaxID=1729899 RepID=A0ABU9D8Q5_9PROT
MNNRPISRRIINAHLIDPASGFEGREDLFIAAGLIVGRGEPPQGFQPDETLDASGLVLCPGLVDLRARLRDPGEPQHGDLQSELRAAVAGGITSLACPPDTEPVADAASVIQYQRSRAAELGLARLYPLGALTQQLQGEQLAEMATLRDAGALAMSNADHPIQNARVLRNALEYAASLKIPVFLHSEDATLGRWDMHEGEVSTRLGLAGQATAAEVIGLMRDLSLIELTGARVHIQHLSSAASLEQFSRMGNNLPLSADVSIHHLHLTHYDIGYFDVHAKTCPPLRTHRDRDALRSALRAGTLAAISSDHSPWHADLSRDTFHSAPFGISGLDTLLPLVLRLVDEGVLDLKDALARVTTGPARILGISAGTLAVGAPADLCLFDPEARFVVDPERFLSRGKNSPYGGWELRGVVRHTFVGGRQVFCRPGS